MTQIGDVFSSSLLEAAEEVATHETVWAWEREEPQIPQNWADI